MQAIVGKGAQLVFVALLAMLVALIVTLPLALVVKWLWNWVIVETFDLQKIGYWQSWGLLLLCWILFRNSTGRGTTSR